MYISPSKTCQHDCPQKYWNGRPDALCRSPVDTSLPLGTRVLCQTLNRLAIPHIPHSELNILMNTFKNFFCILFQEQ